MTTSILFQRFLIIGALALAGTAVLTRAQTVEDCMTCHADKALTAKQNGVVRSLFVSEAVFKKSVHGTGECIGCHTDLKDSDFPHAEKLKPANCVSCHPAVADMYRNSLHGQAIAKKITLAPRCQDCHGNHAISPVKSPESKVSKFNIPFVCGSCHKEGTAVSKTFNIPQDSILDHYSESIHGEGLFKRGLNVTAVCSDCHTAHNVLPHTDPRSSISRDNIPRTCEKCHGRIEEVHRKVINGEQWRKNPKSVPVCVDCHSPHKIRKVFYDQGMADRDCLGCHGNKDIKSTSRAVPVSLYVDSLRVRSSIHHKTACSQCHAQANPALERPCAAITKKVDCSMCHEETVKLYKTSTHGMLAERGDTNAPHCTDCHGTHVILGHKDPASPTYVTKIPNLCGQCHRDGQQAALRDHSSQKHIMENYSESIHGQGLFESGLLVTATCTDCHTAHHVLPRDNPLSSVNADNLPKTCSNCHSGVYEKFRNSIHSPTVSKTDKKLPTCKDCHQSHTISRTDKEAFRQNILTQCGECHKEVTESYFQTYHGKVSNLGYGKVAKCNDCHGSHDILPPTDIHSSLSRKNIVATCGKCHPESNRKFAGYLTHATHHERHKYPILFFTYWFMVTLLTGTFVFAGIHTLLWLPRSFLQRRKMPKHPPAAAASPDTRQYMRFGSLPRQLHVLVIISFLGLAITGMTLKFSYLPWAQWLSRILGGFESAGFIHRIGAIITFIYFGAHIIDLFKRKRLQKKTWIQFLLDANSMLPNRTDLREVIGTLKWFVGRGPRPSYGRWTYWEKFDYFAVFWGVAIIGASGLVLWFPEFFTLFLPGWLINVATIVHSDEALLAVGFIFTIHFFNTHLRPEKFPMDSVIFTGRIPLEEFKAERPREYEELVRSGELEKHLAGPLQPTMVRYMKVFGTLALFIGTSLILLILWAAIFGYR